MSVSNTVKTIRDIMRKDVGVDGDAQRLSQMVWLFFLKILDAQEDELAFTDDDYVSPLPERHRWRHWAADPERITGDELLDFVNNVLFPHLKELPVIGRNPRARIIRAVFEDAAGHRRG